MEIEVGEYVINQNRLVIGQIIEINEERQEAIIKVNRLELSIGFWNIKKHSKNLIDLIEVSDYVNGYKVYKITSACIYLVGKAVQNKLTINIETILTHEQYEQNCYKLEKGE